MNLNEAENVSADGRQLLQTGNNDIPTVDVSAYEQRCAE